MLKTKEMTDIFEKQLNPLLNILSNKTKAKIKYFQIPYIYDCLTVESNFEYTLPNWTHGIYPEKMLPHVKTVYKMFTWNDILKKLRIGPLLYEISELFKSKSNGSMKSEMKLWLISAHDYTVMGLLHCFGYPFSLAPYGSSVIFELLLKDKQYYVKVK